MSERKFTPGPWKWEHNLRSTGFIVNSSDKHIADVMERNGPFFPDVAEANARLIAAAPDLYESCAVLLQLVRLKYGNLHADTNEIQAKARAALAKADGETP